MQARDVTIKLIAPSGVTSFDGFSEEEKKRIYHMFKASTQTIITVCTELRGRMISKMTLARCDLQCKK